MQDCNKGFAIMAKLRQNEQMLYQRQADNTCKYLRHMNLFLFVAQKAGRLRQN